MLVYYIINVDNEGLTGAENVQVDDDDRNPVVDLKTAICGNSKKKVDRRST